MITKYRTKIASALVSLLLAIGLVQAHSAMAQAPQQKAKPKMAQRGGFGIDSRAETRTYKFKEADKDMEYCLFVSSKVSKDKKAPLIVTLHGMGAGPSIMVNKDAVDLAEKGGYILVSPMGYNEVGWYGVSMGAKPKSGKTPPRKTDSNQKAPPNTKPKSRGMGGMFSSADSPENLNELSEKDVMNVLDIVCKEFNVDENRIYLMGHSMGGAGTLHLGVKYASKWAAIAAVAPAAFGLDPNILAGIKDMPVIFVHGADDEVVAVSNTHKWIDKLKELKMTYEYKELPGISHGPVITASLPYVYEFFGKHSKK